MNYCSQCGQPVSLKMPHGDDRERYVCDACNTVHYQNPNNVAGAILTWEDKVLLCQRAIQPRSGLWTLPAGFMENHESVHQAAKRESIEEANAEVGELNLFGVFSLPYISQVYLMFYGRLLSQQVSPGIESSSVGLFTRDQIPWDQLAFPVIAHSLQLFFEHGADSGRVHQVCMTRSADNMIQFSNEAPID